MLFNRRHEILFLVSRQLRLQSCIMWSVELLFAVIIARDFVSIFHRLHLCILSVIQNNCLIQASKCPVKVFFKSVVKRQCPYHHAQNLKILLLFRLFMNFLEDGRTDVSLRRAPVRVSFFLCLSFSRFRLGLDRGCNGRATVAVDPCEMDLAVTRTLDSERGRLIRCVESLRTRFGLLGALLSLVCSVPTARFVTRRRRLEGRASSISKSVGRKAAGAVWKSTTAGAGRRSVADRARKFP
jgi:hypothetical protein